MPTRASSLSAQFDYKLCLYLGYFFLCAVLIAWYAYSIYFGVPERYEADSLVFPNRYTFINSEGGSSKNWPLPFAGYYFDYALYWCARNIFPDIHVAQAVCSSTQTVLFLVALTILGCSLTEKKQTRYFVILATPLLVFAALRAGSLFSYTGIIVYHFMGIIHTLCVFGCLLFAERTQKRRWWLAFFVIVTVAIVSDRITVLWCFLPCAAFFMIQWFGLRKKETIKHFFVLLCAFLAAKTIIHILAQAIPHSSTENWSSPDIGRMFVNLGYPLGTLAQEWLRSDLSSSLALLGSIGLVLMAKKYAQAQGWKKALSEPTGICLILTLLAMGANIAAVASLRERESRYLMAAVFLPVYTGSLFCVVEIAKIRFAKRVLPLLVGVPLLLGLYAFSAWKHRLPPFYPEYVRALDKAAKKHHLTRGAANFWLAHPINALSQTKLNTIPMYGLHLRPVGFNFYDNPPRTGFDFFICDTKNQDSVHYFAVPENLVKKVNGKPANIIPLAEGVMLYHYPDGADLASLETMFLTDTVFAPPIDSPDTALWQGSHIFKQKYRLQEVKKVVRNKTPYAVLFFTNPPEELIGRHVTIGVIGEKSPSHKRKAAEYLRNNPDSVLASIHRAFFHHRSYTLDPLSVEPYQTGSIAVAKFPHRDSKDYTSFYITLDGDLFQIR